MTGGDNPVSNEVLVGVSIGVASGVGPIGVP